MNTLPSEPGLRRRLAYAENLRRLAYAENLRLRTQQRTQRTINTNTLTMTAFNLVFDEMSESHNGLYLKDLLKNSQIVLKNENVCCSICLQEDLDIYRQLICNHIFHINCIDMWLSQNNTCPICRRKLT